MKKETKKIIRNYQKEIKLSIDGLIFDILKSEEPDPLDEIFIIKSDRKNRRKNDRT